MEESVGSRGGGGGGGLDAQIEQLMECRPLPEPEVRGGVPFPFDLVLLGSSSGGIRVGLGWPVLAWEVLGLDRIRRGKVCFFLWRSPCNARSHVDMRNPFCDGRVG